jgi:hypothetical protein
MQCAYNEDGYLGLFMFNPSVVKSSIKLSRNQTEQKL